MGVKGEVEKVSQTHPSSVQFTGISHILHDRSTTAWNKPDGKGKSVLVQ